MYVCMYVCMYAHVHLLLPCFTSFSHFLFPGFLCKQNLLEQPAIFLNGIPMFILISVKRVFDSYHLRQEWQSPHSALFLLLTKSCTFDIIF